MTAKEIISYLENDGGVQYFCNTEGWSVAQCVAWVRENFNCSDNTANVVGEEIAGWV